MGKPQEERKARLDLLKKMLKKELAATGSEGISTARIVAKFCLETNLSKRTAEEYIQLLVDAGEIESPEGYLVTSGRRIYSKKE